MDEIRIPSLSKTIQCSKKLRVDITAKILTDKKKYSGEESDWAEKHIQWQSKRLYPKTSQFKNQSKYTTKNLKFPGKYPII